VERYYADVSAMHTSVGSMTDTASARLETGRQICAVLVTYHPDAELPSRVNRILDQAGGLVIVDNASGAAARDMLRTIASHPSISLLLNPENSGIARALNLGVEKAAAAGFEWVLLLDQDSIIHAGMLSALIAVQAAFPEPARLAVLGAGFDGAADSAQSGRVPWEEAESVITSGSLIPLAMHAAVGPFREEFFIDYVDSEYCFRARAKGYRVIRTAQPLMSHTIGAPTRHNVLWTSKWTTNHTADRRYYIARNDTVMLREYGRYRFGAWALKSLARRLRTAKRILLYERSKAPKIAAVSAGWWDGVRGRLGPRPKA
jgi:rhamnosyltransferase